MSDSRPETHDTCFPVKVSLAAGEKYAYCTCGLSAIPPWCDGTHRSSEFRPIKFIAEQSEDVWICQCKRSHSLPICDGTHESICAKLKLGNVNQQKKMGQLPGES